MKCDVICPICGNDDWDVFWSKDEKEAYYECKICGYSEL